MVVIRRLCMWMNKKLVRLEGKEKKWWPDQLKDLFSNEMVRPDKETRVEIMVAFYMLFCGDQHRKLINRKHIGTLPYSQFLGFIGRLAPINGLSLLMVRMKNAEYQFGSFKCIPKSFAVVQPRLMGKV